MEKNKKQNKIYAKVNIIGKTNPIKKQTAKLKI